MSDWRRYPGQAELDRALAEHIAGQLRDDIKRRGQASLAVSGGNTPVGMFRQLSRCELDWPRVFITLVDERWVTPEDTDSNERLVRANLLQNLAAAAHFTSLKSEHDNACDALTTITRRLAAIPQPFTVVVLGMGGDGHTASWFPRATNLTALLDPTELQVVAATNPVTAPHQRMTLTLATVLRSRTIIIHITGEHKEAVLRGASENHYPVAAILEQATTPVTVWWAP
jgi:6-phosphogluconolactonase